jgi:hypothetical protein
MLDEINLQEIFEVADTRPEISRMHKMDAIVDLIQQQHTIWLRFFDAPSLKRILEAKLDLSKNPVTEDETIFTSFIILHLTTVFIAVRRGMIPPPAKLDADLKSFFALPIPRVVWQQTKDRHDADTMSYLDALVAE